MSSHLPHLFFTMKTFFNLNPKKAFLLTSILAVVTMTAGIVPAVGQPETVPAPPLVGKTSDPSSWTITVTQKILPPPKTNDPVDAITQASAAMTNPRLLQETVEKSGTTYHQENNWENGSKDIVWLYQGGIFLQKRNAPPGHIMIMSPDDKFAPRRPAEDFPELSWITAKAYGGITTYQGIKCYLYTKTEPGQAVTSAWIDFKTRLPIAVDTPATLSVYTFTPGSTDLSPAGAFLTLSQQYQKALEKVARATVSQ
jgi:hypothetical protein